MNYFKAEHLKYKRTISNKLLLIIPLFTAFFAWIVSGFYGLQYMTFYWWYAFLLPGSIAILCAFAHQREENAGKYYSVICMPLSLAKFEVTKSIVLIEKLLISALFLSLSASVSNLISPALAVYSIGQCIMGSVGIILVSIWQIPMCLYLTRKTGIFLPILLNCVFSIFLPFLVGTTGFWWLIPYCWPAKFAEPVLKIAINGTYAQTSGNYYTAILTLGLSLILFLLFTLLDVKAFLRWEGK